MNVHKTWYVKWFLWNCKVLDRFTDRPHRFTKYSQGTNLCEFFKIILYGTGATILTVFSWLLLVMVAVLTFVLFPLSGIFIVIAYMVGCMAVLFTIMATLVGVIAASENVSEKFERLLSDDSTSFIKVLYNYYKGVKEKFCPFITFSDDKKDDNHD